MFTLINSEFFTLQRVTIMTEETFGECFNLINVFTDPKNFDLDKYKKVPFASIIIRGDNLSNLSEEELLTKLESMHFQQYSMYTDDEYTTYESVFLDYDSTLKFHTMMFVSTTEPTNRDVMCIALPCTGILQPIKKSNMYKLYNGNFVVLSGAPFKWSSTGMFYNKLLYLLVDVTAFFQFYEFVIPQFAEDVEVEETRHEDIRGMRVHVFYPFGPEIPGEPSHVYNTFFVPINCTNREDRKGFFSYPTKNLFYLSDIPQGINIHRGSISVEQKLKSNDD